MTNSSFRGALCGLIALCLGAALFSPLIASADWTKSEVVDKVGQVEFRECILSFNYRRQKAQCAYVSVPEANMADAPSAKTVDIFVARFKTKGAQAAKDPMLFIAGGPGQAASESFIDAHQRWSKLFQTRDFYLIDQRGTGRSNKQACAAFSTENFQSDHAKKDVQKRTQTCLTQLDGDVRWYTTSVAIRDFETVRQRLGIAQWNIFGVSYGTRVVQHYMRSFPESVRTAVMDSVVPAQRSLGPDIPIASQAALDALVERCQATPACQAAYPDLGNGIRKLFLRLKNAPVNVRFENLQSGKQEQYELTETHLIAAVRLLLYDTRSAALLPGLLHQAYEYQNYAPLVRNAKLIEAAMQDVIAFGMHNAVMCTEDVPFYEKGKLDTKALNNTYMGPQIVEWMQWMCEVWPKGYIDEGFKTAPTSDVPSLLLSGEFDPITPPAYGEEVLQGLKQARHFTVPGKGHFVSPEGCAPTLIAKFVDEASVSNLQGGCLARSATPPVFTDFNGPMP